MQASSGFLDHSWRLSYRTAARRPDGRPVDILHDFYIPALQRTVRYDRVAGYFRSSSLAAASQGFSALVRHGGKARFIVGADLEPDDVAAILRGDRTRLDERLLGELDGDWPESVRDGVALLAWLVARGHMEIRVALRVHAGNGEPLPFDSRADGYVHQKWALFHDADGRRLYVTGSLNESHTALVRNAENIDVHCDWKSDDSRQRADEAEHDFEALWADRYPGLRVLSLPDAVRARLIRFSEGLREPREIDGTLAALPEPQPPAAPSAREWLQFALIRDAPLLPGGHRIGMDCAPVAPWPHQAMVAQRIVEQFPASQLLCDEVGLGKTIEAGLAIRALVLSGRVKRVLIAAPASLTRQWQRELADKFRLNFARALGGQQPRHDYLLPQPATRTARSLYEPELLIVSTGLLSRPGRLRGLPEFDLVLVDEAHYARRRNPTAGRRGRAEFGQLYRAIRDQLCPRARCLLLATATPMQLDPVEVSDLLALIPRVGPFQRDAGLTASFYELLGRLVHEEPLDEHEWRFLRRCVADIETLDPILWRHLQTAVIEPRSRRSVERWLRDDRPPHRSDIRHLHRLLFAAAPLSRVMLRHTRALLAVYRRKGQLSANLAQRHLLPIPSIAFTEQERQVYEQLERYCTGLAQQLADNAPDSTQRAAVGFYLSFLRLRFASSLFAIRETLRRRRDKVLATLNHLQPDAEDDTEAEDLIGGDADDDAAALGLVLRNRTPDDLNWERGQLDSLLAALRDLTGTASKVQHLLGVLDRRLDRTSGRIRQTVIFTRFADTLNDLRQRLLIAQPHMRIGTYTGDGGHYLDPETRRLVGVERDAIKHRFLRGEIDVLLCTDAAAEGLNLQTADLLVNFDLPWNPMKVEQRIGRIDRIGQTHDDIHVLNLCYPGSVEERVYGRLLERLAQIGAIVGSQQLALLPVNQDDFQALAEGRLTEAKLEQRASERARRQRQQTERMEIPADELYRIYRQAKRHAGQTQAPVTLDAIWQAFAQSEYLQTSGIVPTQEAGQSWLDPGALIECPAGTALTASRTLYDQGLIDERPLHFTGHGDPVFDALLAQLTASPMPACIRRLEIRMTEPAITCVGYAVAVQRADGRVEPELVDTLDQARELTLAEDHPVDDAHLPALEAALQEKAAILYGSSGAMPRTEQFNARVARDQLILNSLAIIGLMRLRQNYGREVFRDEIQAIESTYTDPGNRRYPVRINNLPCPIVQQLTRIGLPFAPTLSLAGGDGAVDAPPILIRSLVDHAWRQASEIRQSALTTEAFVRRLERQVEEMMGE